MIPAKIDSTSITTIRENGVGSIVDWFEQHKQSFYTLGWTYLKNQQQMEELFYQSIIRVRKALPRFRGETSFEIWVLSIFIHTCRELSKSLQASEKSETSQDLFQVLDQLEEHKKEAIVLTYIKGVSKEEAAQLLHVSMDKLKELLFSGIQFLRGELGYGSTYNGCKEYQRDYLDYLERTLDRPKKIDLEKHMYHCPDCQEDLATFQDVMLSLTDRIRDFHVPTNFLENVKNRLAEQERHRQLKNKKRTRRVLVFASVFALLMSIGYFTGLFSNLYYTWTEDDQDLRGFLQQGLGERLNLEAESNGVKIKIKAVVADEVQTLVFYEIEDTKKDNQYWLNLDDGVSVVNEFKIMSSLKNPAYYPPNLKTDVNKEKKNVYQGKISLRPLTKADGTIKLRITKLMKLIHDSSNPYGFVADEDMEFKTGEWDFKIPVTKQPTVEYTLHEKTEVEGIPVRLDKLIIAPTATILQYRVNNEQPNKQVASLNIDTIVVNNKKIKADQYGNFFYYQQQDMKWNVFQIDYGPLFGEKPKEMSVQFGSVHLMVEDPRIIELDAFQNYPQTFEYAGSTISIDKLEVGPTTQMVISNKEIKNREYESLNFQVMGADLGDINITNWASEDIIVDKNGVEYDPTNLAPNTKIEQPRYFNIINRIDLESNKVGEKAIPKKLEIYGYSTTKYVNDVVKISLKK